jgi:hypothetical protein
MKGQKISFSIVPGGNRMLNAHSHFMMVRVANLFPIKPVLSPFGAASARFGIADHDFARSTSQDLEGGEHCEVGSRE